ncbi:MAG: aryl-sulfate sulfotransferase [Bacteroidota bacterium]|nr:aryl-sulfate sulfotransferase [Bacteroidota bacterium]
MKRLATFFLLIAALAAPCSSQRRTVGLIHKDTGVCPGYTLFAPMYHTDTYLIDTDGRLVHSWTAPTRPALSVSLLPDGRLLRTAVVADNQFPGAGAGGAIEIYNWDGSLSWRYKYSDFNVTQHHDAIGMPNGNVLLIAWERVPRDTALAAGRDPVSFNRPYLWPDRIVEVKPTGPTSGDVVWMWRAWDHIVQDRDSTKARFLDPTDCPEKIDVNFRMDDSQDWLHSNGLSYNAALDQVALTVHNFGEVWVIDHSTTIDEAAGSTGGRYGKGGDLLYRWGNPRSYRDGMEEDQQLFGPHDACWIEQGLPGAGNILIFNNGLNRIGTTYSSVEEIVTPLEPDGSYRREKGKAFGPYAPTWVFVGDPPESMFSKTISGAQRLANGNTLICVGDWGRFIEVTPSGRIVWQYINPVIQSGPLMQGESIPGSADGTMNSVFKIRRYDASYPGLAGRDLTPGDFIERYPPSSVETTDNAPRSIGIESLSPHPVSSLAFARVHIAQPGDMTITVSDILGRTVFTRREIVTVSGVHVVPIDAGGLPEGTYMLRCSSGMHSAAWMFHKRGH